MIREGGVASIAPHGVHHHTSAIHEHQHKTQASAIPSTMLDVAEVIISDLDKDCFPLSFGVMIVLMVVMMIDGNTGTYTAYTRSIR